MKPATAKPSTAWFALQFDRHGNRVWQQAKALLNSEHARRAAGVDRTFLYRHRDLLAQLHAAEAQPRNAAGIGPTASRACLQADLLAAQQRAARQAARVHQLEKRLSQLLG